MNMDYLPGPKVVIEPSVPQVAGPFSLALKWSGFDLGGSTKSENKIAMIISAFLCVFFCILFVIALIATVTLDSPPLTLLWADVNVSMCVIIYALSSGICLASWTKRGFLETFQRELARIRTLRVVPNDQIDNYRSSFIKAGVMSILICAAWTMAALKDVVYYPANSHFNGTVPVKNLFGAMPVVYVYMGVTSSIATAIYWLAHEHLRREMSYFNEELVKASRSQQLTVSDIFAAYGRRHLDLMALMQHVNTHLGKHVTISGFFAAVGMANSVYIMATYSKHLSVPYTVLMVLWSIVIPALMMVTIGEPGKIQESIQQTKSILLDDVTLPSATDQRILSSYRMFMDRCNGCSSMTMLNAIPIGRLTFQQVVLVAPNVATLMSLIAKLIHI